MKKKQRVEEQKCKATKMKARVYMDESINIQTFAVIVLACMMKM